jgi:hypothetical protein
MDSRFTHTGVVVGVDARVRRDFRRKVLLRETKTLWVSSGGSRYRKFADGRTSEDWPMYMLDLGSIEPIKKQEAQE